MKSGTNWVGNLLNLHPQVCCLGELHLQSLYQTVQGDLRNLPIMRDQRVRRVMRKNLQAMLRQVLVELADPQANVIGERTPHRLYPLAIQTVPQITLVRDARDVLVSRLFHLYNFPEVSRVFQRFPQLQLRLRAFQEDPWYFHKHPHQLLATEEVVRESLRWWKEHLRSDRRTIATHPNLQVLALKYEDFHSDVEGQRRRMFQFLQVDPRLAQAIPPALLPGFDQERPNEFNRKGRIGDWKNYVTDEVKGWIKQECGDELIRQGYETGHDW